MDPSEPECYFVDSNEKLDIPLERCCFEIEKQLTCKPTEGGLKCYTSGERYYLINDKTFTHCTKEGYNVK
jgi:hypothetical protein